MPTDNATQTPPPVPHAGQRRRVPWRAFLALAVSAAAAVGVVSASGWASPVAPAAAAEKQRIAGAEAARGMSDDTPVWTWANGQYLNTTVVTEEEAAQRPADEVTSPLTKVHMPQGTNADAVLPDGTIIASQEGNILALKGGKSRTLLKSTFWSNVWTEGETIYRSVNDMDSGDELLQTLSLDGTVTHIATLTAPSNDQTPVVLDGRVYWTQRDASYRPRVVSRTLGDGPVEVVAQDAQSPVVTSRGVLVQSVQTDPLSEPLEDPTLDGIAGESGRITGLALVTPDGRWTPLLHFNGWWDGTGIESVRMQTTGNGDLITIASASTAGVLIIDLSTYQAWNVKRTGKDLAVAVNNTGQRLFWNWMPASAHGETVTLDGPSGVLSFDPSSASLTMQRGPRGTATVGANGDVLAWSVPEKGSTPAPGVSDGSDTPAATFYATKEFHE